MITPHDFQAEAVDAIFSYYASGKDGNPVIAMPTASGKSVVISDFCKRVLSRWPRQRIIVSTHVKELVKQNRDAFCDMWPNAPVGVFSAGLNEKSSTFPIVFGGIQSMISNPKQFGWRDLLLVDECHLISGKEDSNYGKFIAELKLLNPNLKVIGFSATPYRTGSGKLSDGPVFTDVIFDLTSFESFNRLIRDGYLSTLIPKRTKIELDVTGVKIQNGDYVQNQLQAAVDKDKITYAACQEIAEQGYDRNSWLVFASGIDHANHIVAALASFGIEAVAVHSKMEDDARDKTLIRFKSGKLRCVVNYGVLTTGFNHPMLDLIAVLRPTTSTVLWVQMLGRGMRTYPGKENCLVLDFAGNTKRLGPINDPVIPKQRNSRGDGVAPIKICECGCYNHTRATVCALCGKSFESMPNISKHAGTDEIIRSSKDVEPQYLMFDVDRVLYQRRQKAGAPAIMHVSYIVKGGLQKHDEYVCFEHLGYARKKAEEWWGRRVFGAAPTSVDQALLLTAQLKVPRQIRVWVNKKYPEVVATVF